MSRQQAYELISNKLRGFKDPIIWAFVPDEVLAAGFRRSGHQRQQKDEPSEDQRQLPRRLSADSGSLFGSHAEGLLTGVISAASSNVRLDFYY